MSDELMLGEMTDEVRAFLESMGRAVPAKPHQYLGPPAAAKRVSRLVEHDPPHGKLLGKQYITHLPIELDAELGMRVTNAFRMQADVNTYLSHLPVHYYLGEQEPDE